MGIILYFLLIKILPFEDILSKNEYIFALILYKEIEFPISHWSKRTEDCIDIITKALVKDSNKRLDILQFISHKWMIL